jgi:GT2 family glycosyltransferase
MAASDPEADRRLVLQSGWFDATHYASQAGRSFSDPAEAAQHYAEIGWKAGLTPSPGFDTAHYLRSYGDARRAGVDPLLHFLRVGQAESRRPHRVEADLAAAPRAPAPERWRELADVRRPWPPDEDGVVDIVIPVFKGFDDTLACIESVLAARTAVAFRLVVVDDASPDAALASALDELARLELIHLLRNPENLGFVRSANRGLLLSARRDVLLLNSDTVVYGDWLDRLQKHAADGVATVTPFSNNAGPFSYPHVRGDNVHRLELPFDELDLLFARANPGRSVEVPTGVGFCFYVARAALNALGPFDEGFSPGYGEENDFCMRAGGAGWRNLAALDVFVRHTGGVSFDAAEGPKVAAGERLRRRHPDYDRAISAFIEADPLSPARSRVDLARVRRLSAGKGMLMLEHGWGGGVAVHVDQLSAHLADEGIWVVRAAPGPGNTLTLRVPRASDLPNLPQLTPQNPSATARILRELGLERVHIHSLAALPLSDLEPLLAGVRLAGLPYDFTVHDYAALCPRLNMVDWGGVYCDNRSDDHCRVCLSKGGVRVGPVDIADWRGTYRQVLAGARAVFAPDPDVADRIRRYRPELQTITIRPHPPLRTLGPRPTPVAPPRERVRVVGVIGSVGPGKGSSLLLRLAGDALERRLPLRYRLFGTTTRRELHAFPNLEILGPYTEADIDERLQRTPPDLMLFPAVAPETFCYALDVAFRNRIVPVCLDLGAPARRIRHAGFGVVLNNALAFDPTGLNTALLDLRIDPGQWREATVFPDDRRWNSAREYYAGLSRPASAQGAGS